MGKAKAKEMLFWTKEEYEKFSDAIKDKPISYYAFQVLYWTGIREGELLATVKTDFDLVKRKLTINKSYQRINGEDMITSPKTEKSNRVIDLPKFLCDEMEDYFGMFYSLDDDTRLFHISKSYLCKCQYKNVVFLSYKHVGKPTCLYDIFSYPQSYIASDPLVGTKVHLY